MNPSVRPSRTMLPMLGLVLGTLSHPAHAQEHRIVGGTNASVGDHPWMVEMLFLTDQHLCGATLIHPQWVLTAGHCALVGDGADMRLLANSINNTTAPLGPDAEELFVDTIYYHPDYDGESGPDLALIRLAIPATTTPVPLLDPAFSVPLAHGDTALALGWGNADTVVFGPTDTLQAALVPLVGFQQCEALYANSTSDLFTLNGTSGLLCAAGEAGSPPLGSGNGDSGGPLLVGYAGAWHQAGVVYGGEGQFATAEFPGVYTSVPYNWSWINALINGSVGSAEPSSSGSSVIFRTLAEHLRVEVGSASAQAVELFSADGRSLGRHPFGTLRTIDLPWPTQGSILLARILGADGSTLAVGRVLRPF